MEKIYELQLGDEHVVSQFLRIERVPGGWIWRRVEVIERENDFREYHFSNIFVPFSL